MNRFRWFPEICKPYLPIRWTLDALQSVIALPHVPPNSIAPQARKLHDCQQARSAQKVHATVAANVAVVQDLLVLQLFPGRLPSRVRCRDAFSNRSVGPREIFVDSVFVNVLEELTSLRSSSRLETSSTRSALDFKGVKKALDLGISSRSCSPQIARADAGNLGRG